MKRFLFSMAFPIGVGVAALVALAIVAPLGYRQTIASPASNNGSIMVVERSALGYRLAHDVATKATSIMMLGTPRVDVPQRSSNGADDNQFVPQTDDEGSIDAVTIESFYHDRAATARRYFITDLGTLGGTESFAYAINDSGQVVGLSTIAGDAAVHSFLYSNGKVTDLYPLNSQNLLTVGPTGINNAGQIASGVVAGGVYVPAVLDSGTGNLTLLGSLGGTTSYGFNGVATSINNRGNAVGYSYLDSINRHAFLYDDSVMTDIGSFGGYSGAFAINDKALIVGFSSGQYNGVAHAFVDSDGVMTDIEPATESYARDVNNRGQVVGEFLTADQSAFHAFLYRHGTFTDLGSARSTETVAFAINDPGQVVGITQIPYDSVCSGVPCTKYTQHAFFYEKGTIVDLNNLIQRPSAWELTWAFDINNRGQIVGYGLVNGKFRAFLLTPAI